MIAATNVEPKAGNGSQARTARRSPMRSPVDATELTRRSPPARERSTKRDGPRARAIALVLALAASGVLEPIPA
jgi:hypothetical protein